MSSRSRAEIWAEIVKSADNVIAKADNQTSEQRVDKFLQTPDGRALYSEYQQAAPEGTEAPQALPETRPVAKRDTMRARAEQRMDELEAEIRKNHPGATLAQVSNLMWADPDWEYIYAAYSGAFADLDYEKGLRGMIAKNYDFARNVSRSLLGIRR